MRDDKESRDSSDSGRNRCGCGNCTQWGCGCAYSGSHDKCICGRCGDRGDGCDPDYGK